MSKSPPHRWAFWCAAVALGFLQIWAHRLEVNPDGISYIEMAWACVAHGLSGLVNGYWSPLYPFLLSLVFRAFRPGPSFESTLVHLVNLAIYLINLACFELFLRELLGAREASPGQGRAPLPDRVIWTVGYILFLWAGYLWLTPALITPDLCVSALSYLAVMLLLRIRRGRDAWSLYLLLGALLGFSYLAKAFMFLLAWVFLACSVWAAGSMRRAAPRVLAATLAFLAIAAPQIVALSRAKSRWTFGDTGFINYLWYVDRIQRPVLGEIARAGVPLHPVRRILDHPPVYDFDAPIEASNPAAYDPSHWNEGLHPYFSLRGQIHALGDAVGFYVQMFSRSGALFAVFLVLFLLLCGGGRWSAGGPRQWPIWFPAYAAFASYALVHVEPRFVGGLALMLLMGVLAAVRPPEYRLESWMPFLAPALVFVATITILWGAATDALLVARPRPAPEFQVARGVLSTGMPPGSRVATIGGPAGPYWAHLAGDRIVAGVAGDGHKSSEFWRADPRARQQVMAGLTGIGVRLVVAEVGSPPESAAGWENVSGTDFYLCRVPDGGSGSGECQ